MKEKNSEELLYELQVHQVELEMQNEELRKAQLALEESREKYVNLYDFAPVGYFTFTREVLIAEVNLTGATFLGVARQKLINRRFRWFVAPPGFDLWDRHFLSVLQQGEKRSCNLTLTRQDGSTFHARLESIRVDLSQGTPIIHTAVTDITERKRAEEKLRASLREKEVLLREIHHRVKNNLQVIQSLLNLQAGKIKDPQALEAFKESRDRIQSMALVHEKLYQSPDLAHIDMADYLQNLSTRLFHSSQVSPDTVNLKLELEEVHVGIDKAIPLGLIINELISNALKHAFPGGRAGEIRVGLALIDGGMFRLMVRDNGTVFTITFKN